MAKDTAKATRQESVETVQTPAPPIWTRVPKGWIILAVFVLAWAAIYLVWNGITFVLHA